MAARALVQACIPACVNEPSRVAGSTRRYPRQIFQGAVHVEISRQEPT